MSALPSRVRSAVGGALVDTARCGGTAGSGGCGPGR